MVRHEVAGRTTLTTRAETMPMQMTSWLMLPRAPRTREGAICTEYILLTVSMRLQVACGLLRTPPTSSMIVTSDHVVQMGFTFS